MAASGRSVVFELVALPSGSCRAVGPGRWFSVLEFDGEGALGVEIRGGAGVDIIMTR